MAWDQGLNKASVAYEIAAASQKRIRVIAGPGTGKSFAMKRRVARLLESKIQPEQILAVTFTRVDMSDQYEFIYSYRSRLMHATPVSLTTNQKVLEMSEVYLFLEYIYVSISDAIDLAAEMLRERN